MKIYILSFHPRFDEEVKIIEHLLEYEGHNFDRVENLKVPEFRKYYKGNGPMILLYTGYNDIPSPPDKQILGFWNLAEYFMKNGLIRC